jgi:hypothetical protein
MFGEVLILRSGPQGRVSKDADRASPFETALRASSG